MAKHKGRRDDPAPDPEPIAAATPPLATRLSIRDVAKRYSVSEETVRRWIRQQKIPYAMTGAMTVRELPGA